MCAAKKVDSSSTPRPPVLDALDIDNILERVLSNLVRDNMDDLMRFRFISHKWNNTIVRLITNSRKSYKLYLRYGPEIPRFIVRSDAQKWSEEILENLTSTLSGTATSIPFDTLYIDRDFFLASVKPQFIKFLEVQGEYIRHLRLNIRREKFPEKFVNYVKDCIEVVSKENLRAIFSSVPNLESLYFCIRFSHYGAQYMYIDEKDGLPVIDRMFPEVMDVNDLPQLTKLTKMTIQEPYDATNYVRGFVKEIIGMAPNLETLYVMPTRTPKVFTSVLKEMGSKLEGSLTSLGITNEDACGCFDEHYLMDLTAFHNLTTLDIDNIRGEGDGDHVQELLQILNATLVKVNFGMGDRNQIGVGKQRRVASIKWGVTTPLIFPTVMESLKMLQVNLNKFRIPRIQSYETQFPVLEDLTFTIDEKEWEDSSQYYRQLRVLLPGEGGKSQTLNNFCLKRPLPVANTGEGWRVIQSARVTFPTAIHDFGI